MKILDKIALSNKNRNREKPSFANINLMGKCNINCYFCIGNEIKKYCDKQQNDLEVLFDKWKSFGTFLDKLKQEKIKKVYLTGMDTDPALYMYLDALVVFLINEGFKVGIRTNGYTDITHLAWFINDEISYSVHSLNPNTNRQICGTFNLPNWEYLIPNSGNNVRISITVNRFNYKEIEYMISYFSSFDNIKYIQLRNICTDTEHDKFKEDYCAFQALLNHFKSHYKQSKLFKGYPCFDLYGKQISFWDPLQIKINSLNYFTDGTYNDNYFITEGYLKQNLS